MKNPCSGDIFYENLGLATKHSSAYVSEAVPECLLISSCTVSYYSIIARMPTDSLRGFTSNLVWNHTTSCDVEHRTQQGLRNKNLTISPWTIIALVKTNGRTYRRSFCDFGGFLLRGVMYQFASICQNSKLWRLRQRGGGAGPNPKLYEYTGTSPRWL